MAKSEKKVSNQLTIDFISKPEIKIKIQEPDQEKEIRGKIVEFDFKKEIYNRIIQRTMTI